MTHDRFAHPRSARTLRRGGVVVKLAVGVVLLAGVAAGGYYLSSQGESATPMASAALVSAQIQSFDISATSTGELEAASQVEVTNPLQTRTTIVELVKEGTMVEAGDMLVRLNVDELDTRLRQEELAVVSARNDLEQSESALKIQESENASRLEAAQLRVQLAQLALERWEKGEVAKRREQLRIAREKAERELDRLERKAQKSRELFAQNFLSADELERDEISFTEAKSNLAIALLDIEIYEGYQHPEDRKTKQSDVTNAEAALVRVQEENAINRRNREVAVESRQEQLRLREEKLAELQQQVAASTISAPTGGLVVYASTLENNRRSWGGDGPLSVGQEVRPNELLVILPDTREMVASVRVHEALAGRVRPGQRATIKVEAVGRTFTGVVRSIGVLAESGGWRDPNRREYTVKIALETGQEGLDEIRPSMRCDGEIVLGTVKDALTVPVQSVFTDGGVQFVYTPTGTRFSKTPVRIGRRSSTHAEVLKGIEAGTQVLIREPSLGEIVPAEWSDETLASAGYTRDEQGNIVPERMGPPRGMGGRPTAEATRPSEQSQG